MNGTGPERAPSRVSDTAREVVGPYIMSRFKIHTFAYSGLLNVMFGLMIMFLCLLRTAVLAVMFRLTQKHYIFLKAIRMLYISFLDATALSQNIYLLTGKKMVIHVRELMGWVRNVVLINVYLDLENPRGSGFRVGGYMGQVREWGS